MTKGPRVTISEDPPLQEASAIFLGAKLALRIFAPKSSSFRAPEALPNQRSAEFSTGSWTPKAPQDKCLGKKTDTQASRPLIPSCTSGKTPAWNNNCATQSKLASISGALCKAGLRSKSQRAESGRTWNLSQSVGESHSAHCHSAHNRVCRGPCGTPTAYESVVMIPDWSR